MLLSAQLREAIEKYPLHTQEFTPLTRKHGVQVDKQVLQPGIAALQPEPGCPCTLHYVARRGDGTVVATTLDQLHGRFVGGTDTPVRVSLMYYDDVRRGAFDADEPLAVLPPGVHVGIATMTAHEVARLRVHLDAASATQLGLAATGRGGAAGAAADEESSEDAVLYYDVLLASWDSPLPRLPPPRDPAESEREQREARRRALREDPPPSIAARVAEAGSARERGNQALKEGRYADAKREYDAGFVHLYMSRDEVDAAEHTDSEEELTPAADASDRRCGQAAAAADYVHSAAPRTAAGAGDATGAIVQPAAADRYERRKKPGYSRADQARLVAARLPLCLNRSLAQLKLGDAKGALWDADNALALIPETYEALPLAAIDGAADGASAGGAPVIDYAACHAKALYRRAAARSALAAAEIAKEDATPRRYWDAEKTRALLDEALNDTGRAASVLEAAGRPADAGIRALRLTVSGQLERVRECMRAEEGDWRRLAQERLFAASKGQDYAKRPAVSVAGGAGGEGVPPGEPVARPPSRAASAAVADEDLPDLEPA